MKFLISQSNIMGYFKKEYVFLLLILSLMLFSFLGSNMTIPNFFHKEITVEGYSDKLKQIQSHEDNIQSLNQKIQELNQRIDGEHSQEMKIQESIQEKIQLQSLILKWYENRIQDMKIHGDNQEKQEEAIRQYERGKKDIADMLYNLNKLAKMQEQTIKDLNQLLESYKQQIQAHNEQIEAHNEQIEAKAQAAQIKADHKIQSEPIVRPLVKEKFLPGEIYIGIPKSQIPIGQEHLYIRKSQVIPPVCPECPPSLNDDSDKCPPCASCERCPEPAFRCKEIPSDSSNPSANAYLPRPLLTNFGEFSM